MIPLWKRRAFFDGMVCFACRAEIANGPHEAFCPFADDGAACAWCGEAPAEEGSHVCRRCEHMRNCRPGFAREDQREVVYP